MSINRELMHVPTELDRATRLGRLLHSTALDQATTQLTALTAHMAQLRSLHDSTQVRQQPSPLLKRQGEDDGRASSYSHCIRNMYGTGPCSCVVVALRTSVWVRAETVSLHLW